jgi:hypothetical protein
MEPSPVTWNGWRTTKMTATIRFDKSALKNKFQLINQDNVQTFDRLCKTDGIFFTLDDRPYVDLLTEINVFFTVSSY